MWSQWEPIVNRQIDMLQNIIFRKLRMRTVIIHLEVI